MTNNPIIRSAVTRHLNRPKPDTIRLWTIQPPAVWHALREQGTLLVDPNHPDCVEYFDEYRDAYDWLRVQMAHRIPGYGGHYPWWAYEHFLDLRFYRWHTPRRGVHLVRLELAIPKEQVLLSAYGSWHCVLNRGYLPEAIEWEDYERELDAWEDQAKQSGVEVSGGSKKGFIPYPEPWEEQMKASWERVFDIEARRPTETIQATFERLELTQVVKVTEFNSMPDRP
jgi:hypothetical protein